uniref:Uncharacterized protein n=1 Tax=Streptomyces sp. NBC_00003 TaxID=2903608 RepID=A0AAU2UZV7_9ACTN
MARVRLGEAERREKMPRAAVEQIEARGVAAARIPDVAASPGVSNTLILYRFSTDSTDGLDQHGKAAPTEVIAEGTEAGEFGCGGAAWRLTALLDGPVVRMIPYPGSLSRAAMPAWADDAPDREPAVDRAELAAAR